MGAVSAITASFIAMKCARCEQFPASFGVSRVQRRGL